MTINYTYDPLGRLTAADYSSGDYYHYTYDPVGNRLTQSTSVSGQQSTSSYQYDIANRLTNVDSVNYTWDNNGNLLSDGMNSYTYDYANRLSAVSNSQLSADYVYNGLGDRLQQTVNGQPINYTLDLNTGLTQVLSDGTNTYLYGADRIAQVQGANTDYFMGDALGSVRQLTDQAGAITLAQGYDPYGNVIASVGNDTTTYGFTGEQSDSYIKLIYLRSRMYDLASGRFLTKDSWQGDDTTPMSYNVWLYVDANPVNYTDPSGQVSWYLGSPTNRLHNAIETYYENLYSPIRIHKEYGGQPGSPLGFNQRVDLIYFSRYNIQANSQLFNFGGMTIGEIYEIEPITLTAPPNGVAQAIKYLTLLTSKVRSLQGKVRDLEGTYNNYPYDWRYVTFGLGDSIPQTVFKLPDGSGIVFWKQSAGLIVYVDPQRNDQVRELMNNPAYNSIRYSVAQYLPESILTQYTEQLSNSATMCYSGLSPQYWDPNYHDPWWWWYTYWKARVQCELNPNGVCRQVIGSP